MIVLKANTEQYNELNGYVPKPGHILLFALDGNKDWIIGLDILEDEDFVSIREQLNELERVEYVPPPEEEE